MLVILEELETRLPSILQKIPRKKIIFCGSLRKQGGVAMVFNGLKHTLILTRHLTQLNNRIYNSIQLAPKKISSPRKIKR